MKMSVFGSLCAHRELLVRQLKKIGFMYRHFCVLKGKFQGKCVLKNMTVFVLEQFLVSLFRYRLMLNHRSLRNAAFPH